MCRHNGEDDFDCGNCAYDRGYYDALEGAPKDPPYKNSHQVNEYYDGYEVGILHKQLK